jgi:elongation factor Ts
MTAITASQVKELRERTGSGMMECKRALVESEGDIEAAIDAMRKAGQAKADKKSSRTAAEGIVLVEKSADGKKAAMVEINSETDFVARDENFLGFTDAVIKVVLDQSISDVDALNAATLPTGKTVEQARQDLVAKIGENISVRRVELVESNHNLGVYVHGDRIGVVLENEGGDADLAKDLAMHVAASNPLTVSQDDIPADVVAREKEIFIAQAQETGKPMEIIEKMISGRIRKFLDEQSLVGQAFVKDPNQKVSALLQQNGATVKQFTRFEVGEGIEKEVIDFRTEVMQQAQGS